MLVGFFFNKFWNFKLDCILGVGKKKKKTQIERKNNLFGESLIINFGDICMYLCIYVYVL